jgi:hypothetical protein
MIADKRILILLLIGALAANAATQATVVPAATVAAPWVSESWPAWIAGQNSKKDFWITPHPCLMCDPAVAKAPLLGTFYAHPFSKNESLRNSA